VSFAYLCFGWVVPSKYIEFKLFGDTPHLVKTRCLPTGDQSRLSRLIPGPDFHARYLSYPLWQKRIVSKYILMQK
jgi:hypothetical protein